MSYAIQVDDGCVSYWCQQEYSNLTEARHAYDDMRVLVKEDGLFSVTLAQFDDEDGTRIATIAHAEYEGKVGLQHP